MDLETLKLGFLVFFGAIAGIIVILAIITAIYHIFRKKKKLHEMAPSNTSFKLSQGEESNKKS